MIGWATQAGRYCLRSHASARHLGEGGGRDVEALRHQLVPTTLPCVGSQCLQCCYFLLWRFPILPTMAVEVAWRFHPSHLRAAMSGSGRKRCEYTTLKRNAGRAPRPTHSRARHCVHRMRSHSHESNPNPYPSTLLSNPRTSQPHDETFHHTHATNLSDPSYPLNTFSSTHCPTQSAG